MFLFGKKGITFRCPKLSPNSLELGASTPKKRYVSSGQKLKIAKFTAWKCSKFTMLFFWICSYCYSLFFLGWKRSELGTSTEEQKQHIFFVAQIKSIYCGRKVAFSSLNASLEHKPNTQQILFLTREKQNVARLVYTFVGILILILHFSEKKQYLKARLEMFKDLSVSELGFLKV